MTGFYRTRTGGSKRPLHLSDDCSQLKDADDVRPVQREWYPNAPICAWCKNERTQPIPDRSIYEAACEAGDSA